MLRKENDRWWGRKPLAMQLAIWGIIINALVATALFIIPYVTDEGLKQQIAHELYHHGIFKGDLIYTPVTISNMGLSMFFLLSSMAMYIGAVILAHDSILKEREMGTAAWLLSKPLSRKAFVLAKVLANCFGMMVIVLFAQGAIAYVLCSIALGHLVDALTFLAGIGMMGVNVLFYLVLAMALGAFSLSRGVTLGVPGAGVWLGSTVAVAVGTGVIDGPKVGAGSRIAFCKSPSAWINCGSIWSMDFSAARPSVSETVLVWQMWSQILCGCWSWNRARFRFVSTAVRSR